ncbi:aromatic amino acid aminotransferase, partial [Pseudomonas sp. MWU12-2534b]
TGSDLDNAQWDQVVALAKRKQLIPFLDIAYQGFGAGLEEDAYAIRAMADAGLSFLISNSFSKIFSLYGERFGGLSVVCPSQAEAELVLGQLKATVRRNYSNPPTTGARLIATVLGDAELKALWLSEVNEMRGRILEMRGILVEVLKQALPEQDFAYLVH